MKCKTAVRFVCLFAVAALGIAQTPLPSAPAFEAVSIRSVTMESHMSPMKNGDQAFTLRPVEFKGVRLSGDTSLSSYVEFACSPLLKPYRDEFPQSLVDRAHAYYQIDAVAPPGTTIDGARVMLRNALAERLGFQFHLTDREVPVYNLVRGSGELKLAPATDTAPGMEYHRTPWELHVKAWSMTSFANFVSGTAGRPVIDKTGIEGRYNFDLDWNQEVQESMASTPDHRPDPFVAIDGVKAFGLKLEPATEMRKFLVVDRVNKEPTPN